MKNQEKTNEWKMIEGWEDYFIHRAGIIKSIKTTYNKQYNRTSVKEKVLSIFLVKGYLAVNLTKVENGIVKRKSVRVHRIVAENFIPKISGREFVNHIDGNKENSKVENLEWCTASENELHSYEVLGKKSNGIVRRKFTLVEAEIIRDRVKNGEMQKDLAIEFDVAIGTIHKIIVRKTYV